MNGDKLSFLDETPEAEEPAEATEETQEVEAAAPEADEPAEPEQPEPAGEPAKAQDEGTGEKVEPPSTTKEEQQVSLKALLDEREKRQRYERELEQLRKQQQKPEEKPDFWSDPDRALSQVQQQVEQRIINERLNFSERLARKEHGAEVVDAAANAFQEAVQKDPSLAMQLQRQEDPYSFVVGWHKKTQFLSEIGDDPDAWKAKQREALEAELREKLQAEMQPSKPSAPPRTLASAPSAGGDTQTAPGSGFDQLFGD